MQNQRIDHISKVMSKRHGIFTENGTIFFPNVGKTGNALEIEFEKF